MSPVMLMELCPRRSATALMCTPLSSQPTATEWRSVCTPTPSMPRSRNRRPAARTSAATLVPLIAAFYRSGALVFGGGHVVLPLLETAVASPGWLTQPSFLAGYGAAQAVPGPLFTFAAYLGASIGISAHHAALYSFTALIGIFLPGLLLITAILPFWSTLRTRPALRSALRGINASVVGVLFAALVRPLATTALHSVADILFALAALALLLFTRVPTWTLVLTAAFLCALIPRL